MSQTSALYKHNTGPKFHISICYKPSNSLFNKVSQCIWFSFIALMGMALLSVHPERAAAGDTKQPAVLELFTSQGCSSCPPADRVLKSYTGRKDVIALSYAVDYWDYIGWRDTFGSAANSERQRQYARTRRDGQVYTPQIVVNGIAHANGASKYVIEKHIETTGKIVEASNASLKLIKSGNKYQVAIDGVKENDATVWLVQVQDVGVVNVKRGENHGKKLAYYNIVKGMKKLAKVGGQPIELTIAAADLPTKKGEHCVVLLQKGLTGQVLAAAEIWP